MIRMLLAATLVTFSAAAAPWPRIALNRVTGGFSNPTQVTSARDGSGRLFVVEQGGRREDREGRRGPSAPFLDSRTA